MSQDSPLWKLMDLVATINGARELADMTVDRYVTECSRAFPLGLSWSDVPHQYFNLANAQSVVELHERVGSLAATSAGAGFLVVPDMFVESVWWFPAAAAGCVIDEVAEAPCGFALGDYPIHWVADVRMIGSVYVAERATM